MLEEDVDDDSEHNDGEGEGVGSDSDRETEREWGDAGGALWEEGTRSESMVSFWAVAHGVGCSKGEAICPARVVEDSRALLFCSAPDV